MRAWTPWTVLALAIALAGCSGSGPDPRDPVRTVLVVGIDGLTFERIDPLIARGELPHLRRLITEGVRARPVAPDPLESPQLWTTALTGKMPSKHRVAGDLVNLPSGLRSVVPSSMRTVRSLVQIAGKEGVRVAQVGFPATWPAEVVNGFLVAQGATPSRWTETVEHTLRRERGQMATFPPALFTEIEPMLRPVGAITREEAARFFVLNETEFEMMYDRPLGSVFRFENPPRDFAISHQRDLSHLDVTLHLLERYQPRLALVHFELLQSLQPVYWAFSHPEIFATPADSRRRFANTVDEGYRWLDERIGRLVAAMPAGSVILVVGNHGFTSGPDPRQPDRQDLMAALPSNEGVFIASGQGFARGVDLGRISLADLTPTVLALLDLPTGADMEGQVLSRALDPRWAGAHPTGSVATHDEGWRQEERYPPAPPSTPSTPEEQP